MRPRRELGARALYEEGATWCHSVKDYVSRDLFESLMKDEEHHIDFLETQLHLIERIGLELYTQKHVAVWRASSNRRRNVIRKGPRQDVRFCGASRTFGKSAVPGAALPRGIRRWSVRHERPYPQIQRVRIHQFHRRTAPRRFVLDHEDCIAEQDS